MVGRPPYRALLTFLVGMSLFGCAAEAPEKPIVLRPPTPEHRAARPAAARRPAVNSPLPVPPRMVDPVLTPAQKSELFDQFDRYLAAPRPPE